MIFYNIIYMLVSASIFIVNIKKYKKLKKEYIGKIEEHILFIVTLVFFFIEITMFTAFYLILKSVMENF